MSSKRADRAVIYRAVTEAERRQVEMTRTLKNPEGIETKYFSIEEIGANRYARLAYGRFGDSSTYDIMKVEVPLTFVTEVFIVDRSISTVGLRTEQLIGLVPRLLNYCLIEGL